MLEAWQPFPALVGLIGSLLIVFVFTTATWWDTHVNFRKVAIAYGAVSSMLDPQHATALQLKLSSHSCLQCFS